jgi:hypothetical protein
MAVGWIIAEAWQGIFAGEMDPRHGEWDNGECGHGSTLLFCLDMMMLPQNWYGLFADMVDSVSRHAPYSAHAYWLVAHPLPAHCHDA